MAFLKLTRQNIQGKAALIRVGMNVPLKGGSTSGDIHIRASLASIKYRLDDGASVIVMIHLGRPTEDEFHPEDDVAPVAAHLGKLLGKNVRVLNDWRENKLTLNADDVMMLQNVHINRDEKKNDLELGKTYASLCDVFVNDAFGTAHRAQAPAGVVVQAAPVAYAGMLMTGELDALGKASKQPAHPMVAIVAGSKVSTKLIISESLADEIDQLIVGSGITNTFLLTEDKTIDKSLAEHDLMRESKKIMMRMVTKGDSVPLPIDVVVTKALVADAEATMKGIADVVEDDMILDIGPKSTAALAELLEATGTVVQDGPVGVFEFDQFAGGIKTLAEAIAQSDVFSIAGGGDTLAAIAKLGVTDWISCISTGGGAFLEFLEGKELPAVAALEKRGT